MFHIRLGVGSKLLGLAVFNAMAFALIALIAALAFNRVEMLASDLARNQISGVLENAANGRELSAIFSEIDLISRNCRSGTVRGDFGGHLSVALNAAAEKLENHRYAESIAALAAATSHLFEECVEVRRATAAVNQIDHQILAELDRLENLVGRSLIDQTLAGKGTDHLDQIMTLTTGYRLPGKHAPHWQNDCRPAALCAKWPARE
ncbi:hypothetical protein [Dechloromonas sp. HYN0024]|uniref:hypothetical protein n=1 Tax=Dechloromonas sp. HYN0024 TaxID=2231055 RepID=UPI0013C2E652|nr:hypothetical protein [Dechloromonas sp. HYN0024]